MIHDSFQEGIGIGNGLVEIGQAYTFSILRIIKAGWTWALEKEKLKTGLGEIETTNILRQGMITIVNSRHETGSKRMLVAAGTEIWSSANFTRPVGITDISVYLYDVLERYGEHEPHAVIECKRVAGSDASLCREYVLGGIDRFIQGKYGERHAVAFMVGYMVTGDVESAVLRINTYLSKKNRTSDYLGRCAVLDEVWARSSRHSRSSSAAPIDLHHAFLEFPQA